MKIKSLAHVCLRTTDLEASIAFYCGALGLTRLFNFTRTGAIIGCYLKAADNTFIEIFLADQPEKTGAKQALNHFCFETEAIEALRARLLASGYSPGEIRDGADHSLQFWVTDPNGLALEFQQYTEQSAQLSGADVEVDW